MASSRRWPWIAPILLYAASALEMIIMVTPFAAFFYSVYTPLFHGLDYGVSRYDHTHRLAPAVLSPASGTY